jgi:F420-dependent oxidoreductase-like protein
VELAALHVSVGIVQSGSFQLIVWKRYSSHGAILPYPSTERRAKDTAGDTMAIMAEFAFKTPPQHGSWNDFLDVWRAGDEIDIFTSGWTMDHFYPLTPPMDGPIHESWTMLGALAQATKRVRLGSMVNGMHFRHPAVTANMAVTLDHISNGRFDLGLGAGWFESEAKAYGIPLGNLKERSDRFEEGVEVIVRLLTQDFTTFSGQHYQLVDARCEPKPLQSPHPPIVIGGSGPKRTLKVVAKWANQWDAIPPSVEVWKKSNDVLRSHCAEIGRDQATIRRSVGLAWPADADPAALAAQGQAYVDAGADLVIFSMRGPYRASFLEPLANELRRLS